ILRDSFLTHSNLDNTNFMCADLQRSDIRGSVLNKTIFVEADLTDAKTSGLDKGNAFLKFSKLKGTTWE
ncbi:MAG TPA: pentapeptide repeat-containing protein, partial [Bacillales bacterium]|nr:pentapeptide repeat-containing protein [Bacillales bacterium]